MQALINALAQALDGVAFSDETAADWPFIVTLYSQVRAEEVAQVSWPPGGAEAFLAQQCALQAQHYRQHYAGARFLVLRMGQESIGRLYVHQTRELRVMDVALIESARNRGIGTRLMKCLITYADAAGIVVSLHVEPFNPAMRLYQRLGFETREERGIYHFMVRPSHASIS